MWLQLFTHGSSGRRGCFVQCGWQGWAWAWSREPHLGTFEDAFPLCSRWLLGSAFSVLHSTESPWAVLWARAGRLSLKSATLFLPQNQVSSRNHAFLAECSSQTCTLPLTMQAFSRSHEILRLQRWWPSCPVWFSLLRAASFCLLGVGRRDPEHMAEPWQALTCEIPHLLPADPCNWILVLFFFLYHTVSNESKLKEQMVFIFLF